MNRKIACTLLFSLCGVANGGEHLLLENIPVGVTEDNVSTAVSYALRNRGWEDVNLALDTYTGVLEGCRVEIKRRDSKLILRDECKPIALGTGGVASRSIPERWVKYLRQDIEGSLRSWASPETEGPRNVSTKEELARRLEKLEFLKGKGLITAFEYDAQRQRILSGI